MFKKGHYYQVTQRMFRYCHPNSHKNSHDFKLGDIFQYTKYTAAGLHIQMNGRRWTVPALEKHDDGLFCKEILAIKPSKVWRSFTA